MSIKIEKPVWARLPIEEGDFRLYVYPSEGKEHVAFVCGEVDGQELVLTRIHSECFTGDVLGSLRCDCGPQLHEALCMIGRAGKGILIYLRQEGRGIGLPDKLRAYNLQDEGYDTVDANLKLGHVADGRDYSMAAVILKDLRVGSVELVTNNPAKIDGLRHLGVRVEGRRSLVVPLSAEGERYMRSKIERMEHLVAVESLTRRPARHNGALPSTPSVSEELESWLDAQSVPHDRPLVTLTYAQSLDGSIALEPGKPLLLSGPESQLLTHRLRRWHDGILVGIGTVLADNPQLTVRLVEGNNPRPIVVDTRLRFPLQAKMLANAVKPWIATGPGTDAAELSRSGAEVFELPLGADGHVDLRALLGKLRGQGIRRLMVEGGATVLRAFLREQLADNAIVTIAPTLVGGLSAVGDGGLPFPKLSSGTWRQVGQDMLLWANLDWNQP